MTYAFQSAHARGPRGCKAQDGRGRATAHRWDASSALRLDHRSQPRRSLPLAQEENAAEGLRKI